MSNSTFNAGFGSILGACVGDAAGSTLEFIRRKPTADEVEYALGIVGGGVFELAPGQVTDDGELTITLAKSLAYHDRFDINRIARGYVRWFMSHPFDIGFTTRSAFGAGSHLLHSEKEAEIHCIVQEAAAKRNFGSKANGSLMRATPLGVWGYQLEPTQLAAFARQDSALSHPNQTCCDAVACYSLAIASLVRFPGDRAKAWEVATHWAEASANSEVRQWLDDAESGEEIAFYPQAGFVKIAFTHAFRHLLAGTDFVSALRETIAGGGDTDTNACIVGGLIGAACGADAIPKEMASKVLECDTSQGENERPDYLTPEDLEDVVAKLLQGTERP